MNKTIIITMMLALVTVAGISNAFDFSIDDEDVAIAVNKDIAGNDIPDEETAVGEATLAVRFLETEGSHVGVNHNLCGGGGVGYANLTENGLHGAAIEACKAVELVGRVGKEHLCISTFSSSATMPPLFIRLLTL